MGVASPSVPAIQAARFVMSGAKIGLEEGLEEATNAAKDGGVAIVSALREGLESKPVDLNTLIPFKQAEDLTQIEDLDAYLEEFRNRRTKLLEAF